MGRRMPELPSREIYSQRWSRWRRWWGCGSVILLADENLNTLSIIATSRVTEQKMVARELVVIRQARVVMT